MLKFKHRDGIVPNLVVIAYIFTAYPLAIYLLLIGKVWLLATILLSHVLIIAAYMLHECAHNTVFSSTKDNARLGSLLSCLTGACYLPYEHLREKHFRHHVQREDVLAVDAHAFLEKHRLLSEFIKALSWCYIPAFDLYTHLFSIIAPFYLPEMSHWRKRVMVVSIIRISAFGLLFIANPMTLVSYAFSYLLMVSVLNFMDAFQHSYDLSYGLMSKSERPQNDASYEEANTYSNLISQKYEVLNVLVLNFCYHNAHHRKPNEPWYRLPAIHEKTYKDDCPQLVTLSEQLKRFHRYRVDRITRSVNDNVHGTDGVSFLVGV